VAVGAAVIVIYSASVIYNYTVAAPIVAGNWEPGRFPPA
jgi:hypothetical protein